MLQTVYFAEHRFPRMAM